MVRELRNMREAETILPQAIRFECEHFKPDLQHRRKPAGNKSDLNLLKSFVENQSLLTELDQALKNMGENVIFLAHTNYTWLEHVFTDPQFGFARIMAMGHEITLKNRDNTPMGKFLRIENEQDFIHTLDAMTQDQIQKLTILHYNTYTQAA